MKKFLIPAILLVSFNTFGTEKVLSEEPALKINTFGEKTISEDQLKGLQSTIKGKCDIFSSYELKKIVSYEDTQHYSFSLTSCNKVENTFDSLSINDVFIFNHKRYLLKKATEEKLVLLDEKGNQLSIDI